MCFFFFLHNTGNYRGDESFEAMFYFIFRKTVNSNLKPPASSFAWVEKFDDRLDPFHSIRPRLQLTPICRSN